MIPLTSLDTLLARNHRSTDFTGHVLIHKRAVQLHRNPSPATAAAASQGSAGGRSDSAAARAAAHWNSSRQLRSTTHTAVNPVLSQTASGGVLAWERQRR